MRIRVTGVGIETSAFRRDDVTIQPVNISGCEAHHPMGVGMGDPRDLLHKASNGVTVLGLTLEKMRRLHPEDATLMDASRAYDDVSQLLKRLREVEFSRK